jgi:hypothetical protein
MLRLERNSSNVEIYTFLSESLFLDLFGLHILVGVEMIQLGVDQFFNRNFLNALPFNELRK